jgi:hypothetical protein
MFMLVSPGRARRIALAPIRDVKPRARPVRSCGKYLSPRQGWPNSIFSHETACCPEAAVATISGVFHPGNFGGAMEILAIGLTVLLGLATWGLYRLAVALKEPS